ncbi:MAG: electron transport complex subunit RsxC [Verrucomicrobiota bacterium]
MKTLFRPRKGVPVPGHKQRTRGKAIVKGPDPKELIFPVMMHSGAPAGVLVKKGDSVKKGTLIAGAMEHVSANIHSSVSGSVKAIETRDSFRGPSRSIIIENNGLDEEENLEPLDKNSSLDQFLDRLEESGITGKGGAGFPAHVKFATIDGHRYMLINGAECEPYSTTDHRVMLEFPEEILRTVELMRQLFDTEYNVIAVEEDKPDAIDVLKNKIRESDYRNISVEKVTGLYPQGDQGMLLRNVFGVEIPSGMFPNQLGVLTSNVSTVKAIHDAVFKGEPLVERVITVTGAPIADPQNVLTRIGTPVRDLIDFCGGFKTKAGKIINGGAMMGTPFTDLDIPAVKDTTTILCLGDKPAIRTLERACIRCGRCIDVCPVNLQPIMISNAYRKGRLDLCNALKAGACIRCGCCTYICPSRIPLLEDIKSGINPH